MDQESFERMVQIYMQQIANLNHQIVLLTLDNEKLRKECSKGDE